MATVLKGADVVKKLDEETAGAAAKLAEEGCSPRLAIVRVGEKPDDIAYQQAAEKRCAKVGVQVVVHTLPGTAEQIGLEQLLQQLNQAADIHGILLLRPLPKQFDDEYVRNLIAPQKDVDGITDASLAGVFTQGGTGFAPCTAQACMEVLDHYGIDPKGKRAVVVGRSLVVGRPVAMLLLARHATVTICHTRTQDMPAVCREAEILVVSAGQPNLIDKSYLSPGQVVLDVGIHVTEDGGLCGDVLRADEEALAEMFTPVPGGIGTVTTSVLAKHTVAAAAAARR